MKKLDVFLLIYKILILLLVVVVLAWGLRFPFEFAGLIRSGSDDFDSAMGMVVIIIFTIIADAVLLLLTLPGLITAICRKSNPVRKRDIIHFSLLTAAPALSFGIFVLVCRSVIKMAYNSL